MNSLKRGEIVQAVVVIFGVVGLRRVDKEQAGPPKSEVVQVIVVCGVVLAGVGGEQVKLQRNKRDGVAVATFASAG